MRIAVGCDHYGFPTKLVVKRCLEGQGHEVLDVGCEGMADDDGLCDHADSVAKAVLAGEVERGVLICGTGVAMCIRANRWPGIRAAVCSGGRDAKGARNNSDINVMVFEGQYISAFLVDHLLKDFVETPFEALERRVRRVAKLDAAIESV